MEHEMKDSTGPQPFSATPSPAPRQGRKSIWAIGAAAVLLLASAGAARGASQGPCDIYAAGGTPCVAAHSTTRVLRAAYTGPLYQVRRQSDNATRDVTALASGIADASLQDTFCTGTTCVITVIYDQSGRNNHLRQAPPGGFSGPAAGGYDNLAIATSAAATVSGKKVYGVYIAPGSGYRNNATNGIAVADQPEGMYAAIDGTHFNGGCCFDYGNAETSTTDTGNGHMETLYFGRAAGWGSGAGPGPWILSDQENGVFSGSSPRFNANDPTITHRFITAIVKGEPNHWSIRGGNAQAGSLSTFYNGVRVSGGYSPMSKEGAIVLGIGGDNSHWAQGTFYEGAMTSGYPSDATEDAVQANLVAAAYRVIAPSAQSGRALQNVNSGLCLDDYNWATKAGSPAVQWPCNGLAPQKWNIVPATDGYVTIVNANSGLCLDDTDWATADGSTIQQWTCNGLAVQQWRLVDVGSGQVNIVNRNSNLCLDDYNFQTAAGSEVRQWTCNGLIVQRWNVL